MTAKKKISDAKKHKNYIHIELKFKSLFPFPPRKLLNITDKGSLDNTNTKTKIYSKELAIFLALVNNTLKKDIQLINKNTPKNKKEEYTLNNYFITELVDTSNITLKQVFLRKEYKHNITFIRAPYRGKNAQVHITKKYHNLLLNLYLPLSTNVQTNNIYKILPLINLFKDFSSNHLVQ